MKQFFLTFIFFLLLFATKSQNIDSVLSVPQTLDLSISTPQPRLNEKFQISLDINYIRAHIFKSALGKIRLTEQIGNTDENLMILNVNAEKKGKTEIGPLQFILNGTKYTTNKIEYEVIDALPNVDKGLWFRKVVTGSNTFCIIIEQRIPATNKTAVIDEKTTRFYTEAENNLTARFKDTYSVQGLEGANSSSYSNFDRVIINGVEKEFMYSYSITYLKIVDPTKKISITKDVFKNLPDDYKFENIIIR